MGIAFTVRTALALCAAGLALTPLAAKPSAPANLSAVVGNARTVIFGEDSHGMAAVHELVPPMFEQLVEKKGFRVFVFEAQWHLTDAFRDFMASDRTELSSMEQFYLDGAFASKPVAAMLVWIRNWNRAHPKDPITIFGYQPEQAVVDSTALVAFLQQAKDPVADTLSKEIGACQALDPALKTDLDMIIAYGKVLKQGRPAFTPAARAACLAVLDKVDAYIAGNRTALAGGSSTEAVTLARLHALSLRTYVAVVRNVIDEFVGRTDVTPAESLAGQGRAYAGTDAARFKIYTALRDLYFPKQKVFLWMHDWHAARHASEIDAVPGQDGIPKGTVSIGERIVAERPRDVVVIGNVVPCGTTCVDAATSVETPFARKYGNATVLVDLRKPRAAAKLAVDRPGIFYANQNRIAFGHVVLRRQFDAVLYVPKTEPIR